MVFDSMIHKLGNLSQIVPGFGSFSLSTIVKDRYLTMIDQICVIDNR